MVDFNKKHIDKTSKGTPDQRAHHGDPPEVMSGSETKQDVSGTDLGLPLGIFTL